MCGAVIAMVPFEGSVRGSLERSRDDRAHVQHDTLAADHDDRATPLSGTQLFAASQTQDSTTVTFSLDELKTVSVSGATAYCDDRPHSD
jgi:hypothetical protein